MVKELKLNIFDFLNYRDFLKEFYKRAKERNEKYSFRMFSRKAGFNSPNFLHMVMNGIRNLTKDCLPKFAKALELNKKEHHYFEALVAFNQAKEPEAKSYYLSLVNALRKDKVGTQLDEKQFELLSSWYYPVIRELATLPHFWEDHIWIKKQLGDRIEARQARNAIDVMLKIGLLRRDENGKIQVTDIHFTTEEEVKGTVAYNFHQQMLSLAKDTLSKTHGSKREMSGVTMAVSEKQFIDLKKMVQDFENTVLSYLSDNPDVPNRVMQLNVQLFPVAGEENGGTNA